MTWHREAFPNIPDEERPGRIAWKLVEEVTELFECLGLAEVPPGKEVGDTAEELADVTIMLVAYAAAAGINLGAAVAEKWAEVKTREFELRPDGRYYRKDKGNAAI